MDLTTLLILIGIIAVIIIFVLVLLSKQYRKVGPNEVLIISGGRKRTVVDPDGTKRKIGYRMHIGGGTLVLPFLESAQVLPLEVYTLDLQSNEAITAKGIQINAFGQAQIKIGGDESSIRLAAEQFLGKGEEGIRDVASKILEGHMRAALGTMSVEELFQKRGEFASNVKRSVAQDFARMGLDVLSFSLKDISDTSGYIEALGKPRIAEARSEAAVAEANAEKEATIKAADARKEADIAKFKAESEIAEANREYELKRAEYQAAVNEKKAAADLSYELERQKMNQKLKKEEYQVRLVEKDEAIKLEEKEIQRKEKELESTVKKQADARKYQVMAETEAEQYRLGAQAKARAEAIKLEGEAEAEIMHKKAESYSEYNQAAVYEMLIKIMPELARAVSEPLSKVDKIVMVDSGSGGGASKITKQVADVLAQLPAVVESLSGVDLKKLIEKIPQSDKNAKKSGEKS
ncbi:MAG: flotillin [Candidatus Zixiibacteriota bacterium]|nr:MAG: flotillin [candidate division Zixibacteria bacterium]